MRSCFKCGSIITKMIYLHNMEKGNQIEEIISTLTPYFKERRDVCMAFIFGSSVKGTTHLDSDMDIALYFYPKVGNLEIEENGEYDSEEEIWSDIEELLSRNIDLIILNRAPVTLASSVFYEGIPVVIKDRNLYWRYFLTATKSAEEFRELIYDFREIKKRSTSLSEIDRERLVKVVDFLMTELSDIKLFLDLTKEDYLKNSSRRRDVERWAENIINATIDTGKIILAAERKRIPQTYREIVSNLSQITPFSTPIVESLGSYARLRNILAHEYLDIRFSQIKRFVAEAQVLYDQFLASVESWIKKHTE